MKIHYAGYTPGASGYGWATANRNLVAALEEMGLDLWDAQDEFDVVFQPLINHDFKPATPARAKVNLGYAFFESPLGPNAAANAKKYDTVFVGSTWCLERLQERGITNGKVLIQGVDHKIFKAQPPRKPDGQFRIFSGGKFEYRKGQDLVIAAFKKFSRGHDDAHLFCSWFNLWPHIMGESLRAMESTIKAHVRAESQPQLFASLLAVNDAASSRYTILPQCSQDALAFQMRQTDIGLFPNRCEGGTNLVLMEYASCGRKIIANAKTGHADISGAISYEIPASTDENHWAVQEVDDIVAMLELAYENRETPEHWSKTGHASSWTWEAAAETIVEEARRLL